MSSYSTFKGQIKREIRIHGVEAPVIVTLDEMGIAMSVAGQRLKIGGSWFDIASNLHTPLNVPSYLADRPVDLLCYQAKKKGEKK